MIASICVAHTGCDPWHITTPSFLVSDEGAFLLQTMMHLCTFYILTDLIVIFASLHDAHTNTELIIFTFQIYMSRY